MGYIVKCKLYLQHRTNVGKVFLVFLEFLLWFIRYFKLNLSLLNKLPSAVNFRWYTTVNSDIFERGGLFCHVIIANFYVANMSFNAIRKNKILAKNSELTVYDFSRLCCA